MTRRPLLKDDGFTLLEALVSLGLLTVVLAAVSLYFLSASATNRRQADTQTATQLAISAMERTSLLPGAAVLSGRSETAVRTQHHAPGVDTYLAPTLTEPAWQTPADEPTTLSLPTTPEPVTIGGTPSKYHRSFYVGTCWRPLTGGDCVVVPASDRPAHQLMYRVVVAITWPSRDCTGGTCSYVTALLHAPTTADPTFGL